MAYLADTNIVIRRVVTGDPQNPIISLALTLLHRQGETVHITAQNLVEFQALATRPVTANGWGLTTAQTSPPEASAPRRESILAALRANNYSTMPDTLRNFSRSARRNRGDALLHFGCALPYNAV